MLRDMAAPSPGFPAELAGDDYCYLLTTGRRTGLERTTEIWFAIDSGVLYVLAGSGERASWVRNLRASPRLSTRIRDLTFPAQVRDVRDAAEEALARRLLVGKYQPGYASSLEEWGRTALPLAFEVTG